MGESKEEKDRNIPLIAGMSLLAVSVGALLMIPLNPALKCAGLCLVSFGLCMLSTIRVSRRFMFSVLLPGVLFLVYGLSVFTQTLFPQLRLVPSWWWDLMRLGTYAGIISFGWGMDKFCTRYCSTYKGEWMLTFRILAVTVTGSACCLMLFREGADGEPGFITRLAVIVFYLLFFTGFISLITAVFHTFKLLKSIHSK